MKSKKICFVSSLVSFLAVSIAIFMMYFLQTYQTNEIPVLNLVCGLVFWIFLLAGIVLQIILSIKTSKWIAKNRRVIRLNKKDRRIGIVSFFKNTPGVISDIALVLSIIALVVSYYITGGVSIVCYVSLSVVFLSFCTHCIFNGKNFYYMKNGLEIEELRKKDMEES